MTAKQRPASQDVTPFTVTPLSNALGAEVEGLDLAADISDATFNIVLEAWHQFGVLVFRDQSLTAEQQLRFAARFGPPGEFAGNVVPSDDTDRNIMMISNIKKDGKAIGHLPDGEMFFHSDKSYVETPYSGTFLYAIEIPSSGGETRFANLTKAYEVLPAKLKARINGLKALHLYNYTSTARTNHTGDISGFSHYWHPLVTRHPGTGKPVLFVSRLMTTGIEGLSHAESDALLDELVDYTERPELIYEHNWRVGDLTLWDNRCVNHGRNDFPATDRRLLRRSTAIGGKPVAYQNP